MKLLLFPLLAAALALLSGCASEGLQTGDPRIVSESVQGGPPSADEIVHVGDKLEIYILQDESFNGVYTVRDGGHIIFPKVGRVDVAGKSLGQAEATIKQTFENPQSGVLVKATVILERHGARKQGPSGPDAVTVYLSGQVNRPGAMQVPYIAGQRPSAYQAIVHGGGMADFARPSRAYIIRSANGGQERINLNLDAIGKGTSQDIPVMNGDIIIVPEKRFLF